MGKNLAADKTSAKVGMWLTQMRSSEAGAPGRTKRRAKRKVR